MTAFLVCFDQLTGFSRFQWFWTDAIGVFVHHDEDMFVPTIGSDGAPAGDVNANKIAHVICQVHFDFVTSGLAWWWSLELGILCVQHKFTIVISFC